MELPSGTVTFLFTDIEGSTRLLRAAGDEYASLLEDHRRIIRGAAKDHGGHEIGTEGDSFFITFARPSDGLKAALQAQVGLCKHGWPEGREVRVRMGLHTGEASVISDDYVGLAVHQAARISSAAHGKQVLLSGTIADLVRDVLDAETELVDVGSHRLKDFDRPIQLFQVAHPQLPEGFDTPTSAGVHPTNLPAQVTNFIGRAHDLDEVKRLLETTRLLTLTGAGGVGKTRLALEAATAVVHDYPDGVWLVDLAPIAEPELIPQAVGQALGIGEPSGSTGWLDHVMENLRDGTALLIFDNCEHLLTASCDAVTQILSTCGRVSIVATTREPLGADGEIAWRVPSLGANEEARGDVELFIDRARQIDQSFVPNEESIGAICRHLDGIPLAIELAAARTQALSTDQILERLDDRFRLLRGGGRRRVERQQTMRATVDWSYALLDSNERTVLSRLAVFAGGCVLESAEEICAGGDVDESDVLEILESLVRKSLVLFDVDPDRGARYRMLETIRQYAFEKLIELEDATEIRTRHRDHFVDLCLRFEETANQGKDLEATIRLDEDLDNVRAALEWHPAGDDGRSALIIIGSLLMYFMMRGHLAEVRTRGIAALEADTGAPSVARLKTLNTTATAAFHLYDFDLQERVTQEALRIAPTFGDDPDVTLPYTGALISDACLAIFKRNDQQEALEIIQRAVAFARSKGDDLALGWALFNYAAVVSETDRSASVALYEEALSFAVGKGWRGMVEPSLAVAVIEMGDLERGRLLAESAVTVSRETRYPLPLMRALNALSLSARLRGDLDLARAAAEEHILVGREAGEQVQGIAAGKHNLALALQQQERVDEALPHAEEALSILESLGIADQDPRFANLVEELRG